MLKVFFGKTGGIVNIVLKFHRTKPNSRYMPPSLCNTRSTVRAWQTCRANICALLLFCFVYLAATTNTHQARVWEVFEITLTSDQMIENPYGLVAVGEGSDPVKMVFSGVSGAATGREMTITGFWYGGRTWKVRFAPPLEGTWEYRSHSRFGGLDNITGILEVSRWTENEVRENPVRRGLIRVNREAPRAGRYFVYADGEPFLWVGDTWWNWAKIDIPFFRFRDLADDRAEKGFTIGQLFVPGNGWGAKATIHEDNFTTIDTEHIKKIDSIISYANSRGLTVWIHAWWARENMDRQISEELVARWWRYLIHRYGAYNVVWVLAGEYNMYNYGGYPFSFWVDLGRMIKKEDPWDRIVSTHPTPPGWEGGDDAPQWSTAEVLHDAAWLDYNQSQTGHGKYRNELTPSIVRDSYRRDPPKPVVVTEPWYEFVEGNPTAMDIRFGAWSAFLSGAAGHSYAGGHVWKAHVPESPMGPDSWPMDLDFGVNTMDYPGAVSMGVMSRFLHEMEWWRFEPSPELMLDYPGPFCATIRGEKIMAYLRYGGGVIIDFSDFPGSRSFRITWLDPSSGEKRISSIRATGKTFINSPASYPGTPEYRDWVMLIEPER
jgi:hypothetical protein